MAFENKTKALNWFKKHFIVYILQKQESNKINTELE